MTDGVYVTGGDEVIEWGAPEERGVVVGCDSRGFIDVMWTHGDDAGERLATDPDMLNTPDGRPVLGYRDGAGWYTRADLAPKVTLDDVRDFPNNTCPASRTVQQWADEIDRVGVRVLQDQDPAWIADTLRAVVASLWACRSTLAEHREDK